ncbi:MAG: cysteine desulfurase [Erysipelotrichaceae bacterium]
MLDVKSIRKDFPMFENTDVIYLDNAATTFKPQCVIDAIHHYYTHESVSVHRGDYELSYQLSMSYEETRKSIAKFLNCDEKEVVFTSGASGSLNLVAYGYGLDFLTSDDVILTTEAEHASNILPWFKVSEETGAKIEYVPLESDGLFTIEAFKKAIHEKVKVVTLANVSNVLGYSLPIKEICAIAHEFGAVVICDGAQSVPHMKTDVKDSDVDFLAFSGHKMCGPTGVGVLYGKFEHLKKMKPLMLGGGSNARFDICGNILLKEPPYKFEAGTPAIEAVLGLNQAAKYLMSIGMDEIAAYEQNLHQYLIKKLKTCENVQIYNPNADCGIVAFNIKGVFAQDASSYLSKHNIAVRAGNHCAKILMDVLQTSHTLRASLYFYNTYEEIDHFIEVVKQISVEKCIDLVL